MTKKHYQARSCYALDLFCTARNERANLENEVKDIPPTFMNLDEILMQQRLSNRSKQVIFFCIVYVLGDCKQVFYKHTMQTITCRILPQVGSKRIGKGKPPLKRNMTLAIISLEDGENPSPKEFRSIASALALKNSSPRCLISFYQLNS